MNQLRNYLERRGFEVCARTGERMGIAPGVVRKHFIYISFLTIGSPVLLYIFAAFWLSIKDHLKSQKHSVLDI
jgi:phage shock protein PspC (stress-responsive transcriptional regulator)